jgi:hypothetical protein
MSSPAVPVSRLAAEGLVLQPDEFELWKVEAGNRNEGGTEPTVATFHVFAYVVDCE